MKKFYLIPLVFLCFTSISFAQWEWIHPLPQGNDINCMDFISSAEGFAGTGKGIVLKTTNGGNTWIKHYTGHFDSITGIAFSSSQLGCLIQREYFLVTSNGGSSWNTRFRFSDLFGDQLQFISQDTGWISGEFNGIYKLVYTANAGLNFQTVYTSPSDQVNSFFFLPGGKGWISLGNGDVQITTDYGQNWQVIAGVNSTGFNSIRFIDTLNGFGCGDNGEIYSTVDGGQNWTSLSNPASFSGIAYQTLHTFNTDTLVVAGTDGFTVQTTDAGMNWTVAAQPGWFTGKVIEAGGQELYLGGSDGEIRKSIDFGLNWNSTINAIAGGNDLFGATHDQGTAWFYCGEGGTILNYNGSNLTPLNSGISDNLYGIAFTDPANGVCVGDAGTVLRTTNAGGSWLPVVSNTTSMLKSISRSGNTMYASGENETVIKSVNGGASWTNLNTPVAGFGYIFETVQFIHPDTGFVFTDQTDLITTTDGGSQWNFYSVNSIGSITHGYFLDGNNGWVCTNANEIFATTDGGMNWNLVYQHFQNGVFNRIWFISQTEGFVWADGYVFHTLDGGSYWSEEYLPYTKQVNAVNRGGGQFSIAGAGSASILRRSENVTFFVQQDSLCMDNSYTGTHTYSGNLPARNGVIQLSDENGDFYNPMVIGVTSTGQTSFSFTVPTGIPDQSGYRLRAVFENPPLISEVSDAKTILYAPDAQLFAAGPTVFCPGDSVILFATGSPSGVYSWFVDNVLIPNVQGDILVVYTTGDYQVQVTDGLCSSTSQVIDVVVSCPGLAENGNTAIRLFPNPARDMVTVEWETTAAISRIFLRDISGRLLQTYQVSGSRHSIAMDNYAPGTYLMEIENDQRYTLRFAHY